MQFLQHYLLRHSLHLYEHVLQRNLSQVVLEIVLLRSAIVRPDYVDLRLVAQLLHRLTVTAVEFAQIIERQLRRGPSSIRTQ
jgi:hypothetical protein